MFERFTESARWVVVRAQEEAREFKHNYIGTEHLLLGLLRQEEGLAARVLASLDVTIEAARVRIATIVGEGDDGVQGQIPFTPRAKKTLENALRESLSLGHNQVGTEHLLLGLISESEAVASRILLDLGAEGEKIRALIVSAPGRSGEFPKRTQPPISDSLRTDLNGVLDAIAAAKRTAKADKDSKRVAMIVYAERLMAAMLEPAESQPGESA